MYWSSLLDKQVYGTEIHVHEETYFHSFYNMQKIRWKKPKVNLFDQKNLKLLVYKGYEHFCLNYAQSCYCRLRQKFQQLE